MAVMDSLFVFDWAQEFVSSQYQTGGIERDYAEHIEKLTR
jgi:hypothetical protein